MWMPHDDSFLPDYISQLVDFLEARPQVVLAFGAIDAVDLRDVPLPDLEFYPPAFLEHDPRKLSDSWKLLFWGGGIPFRDIFRKDVVVQQGLYVRPTHESIAADAVRLIVCRWMRLRSLTELKELDGISERDQIRRATPGRWGSRRVAGSDTRILSRPSGIPRSAEH